MANKRGLNYPLYANFRMKCNFERYMDGVKNRKLSYDLEYIYFTVLYNIKAFKKCIHYMEYPSIRKIKKIINEIIPTEVYGSNYNRRKFMKIIDKLCTASVEENLPIKLLLHNWRLTDIEWLEGVNNSNEILTYLVIWLLELIKDGVLGQLFFIQRDRKTYESHLFPLHQYQRLCDKAMTKMINKKQLIPVKHDVSNCSTVLKIIPRNNMKNFRPIVKTTLLKDINKFQVNDLLNALPIKYEKNLYKAWMQCEKKTGNQPLYAIKIDLQDAFSNINVQQLNTVINKISRNKYLKNALFSATDKEIIRYHTNKHYYWNRGLMQGMVFAAKLCELDRRYFDNTYLSALIKDAAFFHRTVDDYLYCSTNKNDILRFQAILEKHCLISKNKTETNVDGNLNSRITYAGRIFNMDTKEIEIKIDPVETYRYKSKQYYSSPFDSPEMLKKICDFACNCFSFNKVLINGTFNSRCTVLENYFKGMITVAFKLVCAIKERFLHPPVELEKIILEIISDYVNRCFCLILKTTKAKNAKQNRKPWYIEKKLLKVVGIQAFILVLKLRYTTHRYVIDYLKQHIVDMCYSHVAFRRKFFKMPFEFQSVRISRVPKKYK